MYRPADRQVKRKAQESSRPVPRVDYVRGLAVYVRVRFFP